MAPRSTSMAPSFWPSSRWSLGSKPSAAKSRGVPRVSRTVKSSLAADRDVGVHQVAEPAQQPLGLLRGLVLLRVGGLHRAGQFPGAAQQFVLLLARGLRDELAELLLLGAEFVEADTGGPAPLVGGEHRVDEVDVLSTGALGGARTVGVLTEQAKVNHPARVPVAPSAARFDIPLMRFVRIGGFGIPGECRSSGISVLPILRFSGSPAFRLPLGADPSVRCAAPEAPWTACTRGGVERALRVHLSTAGEDGGRVFHRSGRGAVEMRAFRSGAGAIGAEFPG